jgi:hypothetical protein
MDFDKLMEKVSSAELHMSPALQDVMARVRTVGLHKAAAAVNGMPEITVKTAAQRLGARLVERHRRYEKIASGLQSLVFIEKTAVLPFMGLGAVGAHRANPEDPAYMEGAMLGAPGALLGAIPATLAGHAIDKLTKTEGATLPAGVLGALYGSYKLPEVLLRPKQNKEASVLPRPTAAVPNPSRVEGLKRLLKEMQETPPQMPQAMGGAIGSGGSSGMFSAFDNAAEGVNPKATLRGSMLPHELPAIRALPGR